MSYQFAPLRIRGKIGVIQTSDVPSDVGKFAFELSFWDMSGEKQIGEPKEFGPFDTESQAVDEMKKVCKIASDEVSKAITGETSDKYFDLKNGGVLRPWVEN